MNKTYLDSRKWLISLKEIWNNEEWIPKYTHDFSEKTNNILKNKFPEEKIRNFEEIYENFNIKNVFENESIKDLLKEKKWEIFNNYIDFCNFLIKKIENAKSKKEIIKIPQIISNLYNYKWDSEKKSLVIQKRNEVMNMYKQKIRSL